MMFGVIDLARDPIGEIETALARYAPDAVCLYRDPIKDSLRRQAPHLAPLPDGSKFAQFWKERGWGEGWGVVVRSEKPLEAMRRHLRKFLKVQLPDGDLALFRFYDPLVLPAYLRSCNRAELAMWFADVAAYRVETSASGYIDFMFNGVALVERAEAVATSSPLPC